MAGFSKKVYDVRTGLLESSKKGQDIENFSSFKIIAHDAEEAIQVVKDTFKFSKGEYIHSMKVIATLD